MTPAVLALEDGSVFLGESFGAPVGAEAEVVFNTSMTGYQEIATDPSYRGQMVCMTYPLIGNYGVASGDAEARRPWISGLIVRELAACYSNWRAEGDLDSWLRREGIPGIHGIDTRALTRRLRVRGALRGVLTGYAGEPDVEELVGRAGRVKPLGEQDLVSGAAVETRYQLPAGGPAHRVVVMDCGIKQNILRSLGRRGAELIVVPYAATSGEISALRPDGIVISNGPGDPAALPEVAKTVGELMAGDVPILGICLGHQLIGLAAGGTTSRLPFGHHGGNHPVRSLADGRVHITSQNHEFQVDADSLPRASGLVISQVNLNDRSVEGLRHASKPILSVQYHPEGAPGPQDNQYVFDAFLSQLRNAR
ncbi:MAG TPA: glutamine-hydrolyzing carbamoyl-phosphate synthase small subunit [Chloroflexota bacterium]|nr:glutamine-hydrolyzing carbamoyl-phosphate synthase small subunit [Chloroflexota bacterium]